MFRGTDRSSHSNVFCGTHHSSHSNAFHRTFCLATTDPISHSFRFSVHLSCQLTITHWNRCYINKECKSRTPANSETYANSSSGGYRRLCLRSPISTHNTILFVTKVFTYIHTYLLAYVLHGAENLTASQLVKKFPPFYGTRRFITAFTSARHLSLT